MTVPSDPSALVAHLAILAAAATAEYGTFSTAQERLDVMRTFTDALIDAWPDVAAAIRDLTAQVEELKAAGTDLGHLMEMSEREQHLLAERDALAARLDAAVEAIAAARGCVHRALDNSGIRPTDVYVELVFARDVLDAWRALSPSGGGHDTDTGGGG